jgi:hypothetical protein
MDLKETVISTGQWLRKANAKAVFACLLVAFLGVSAFWVYSLMSEVKKPSIAPLSRSRNLKNLPLGVIALADSVSASINDSFPSVSPFAGAPAVPKNRTRPEYTPRTRPDIDSFLNRFRRKPADSNRPEVNRPETVSLVYKGIFKRSDGVKMALIENSKSGRSSFYKIDGDIFGMTLNTIEAESIEILQENGEPLVLQRDQSAVFVEGKHAP